MFIIYGKKTARIKSTSLHHERCKKCGAFDISVMVLQDYFHLYYIPVWTIGPKNVKAWCHDCGEPFGSVAFEKEHEAKARTPFYLYSWGILVGLLILVIIVAHINTQNEKAAFVQAPKIGDRYLIRKEMNDSTVYYFMKVQSIDGDSITLYHNSLLYSSYPSGLHASDSFAMADPIIYTKFILKKMLEDDDINAVERYGN